MIKSVAEIKADVRACIDQDRTSEALITPEGDMDVLMLDKVIESKILEAVERVHTAAPYALLEDVAKPMEDPADTVHWEGTSDTCGWILLPDDYMRLMVFEMSDWERAVYVPMSTADPAYAKQRSRVKGLRGTPQKPVCVEALRPEGRVLEIYSCKSREATITKAMYVAVPTVVSGAGVPNSVEISARCYDAVVYTCAALTLVACNEGDKAKNMFEMANTFLTK